MKTTVSYILFLFVGSLSLGATTSAQRYVTTYEQTVQATNRRYDDAVAAAEKTRRSMIVAARKRLVSDLASRFSVARRKSDMAGAIVLAKLIYKYDQSHKEALRLLKALSIDLKSLPTEPVEPGVSGTTKLPSRFSARTLTLKLAKGMTMNLVRIPAGRFTMGSPGTEKGRKSNEGPQRRVTIGKSFYMAVTEVTQAQWTEVMGTTPWKGKQHAKAGADRAASYITWHSANAFCEALSKKTGRTVRLPTEAEWEYACRAGMTTAYSFGADAAKLDDYAWWRGNTLDKGKPYSHPVGVKKPNAWGLHDMHGNVMEWCADWYSDSYANADTRDPKGPATGKDRVLRCGSWSNVPDMCRTARRNGVSPDPRIGYSMGLRVVVESGSRVD